MAESRRKTEASMALWKPMMFHRGAATPGLYRTNREAKLGAVGAVNVARPCSPGCQLPLSAAQAYRCHSF